MVQRSHSRGLVYSPVFALLPNKGSSDTLSLRTMSMNRTISWGNGLKRDIEYCLPHQKSRSWNIYMSYTDISFWKESGDTIWKGTSNQVVVNRMGLRSTDDQNSFTTNSSQVPRNWERTSNPICCAIFKSGRFWLCGSEQEALERTLTHYSLFPTVVCMKKDLIHEKETIKERSLCWSLNPLVLFLCWCCWDQFYVLSWPFAKDDLTNESDFTRDR